METINSPKREVALRWTINKVYEEETDDTPPE